MPLQPNQRKRLLEDRSRLVLEFPQHGGKFRRQVIPFYENPIINENQSASLVNYEPVGRPGSIFTYTGAKSREFSVAFGITLDHIMDFYDGWLKYNNLFKNESREEMKTLFLLPLTLQDFGFDKAIPTQGEDARRDFFSTLASEDLEDEQTQEFVDSLKTNKSDTAISSIMFWINLVRSVTLNNSSDPTLGPPIVRLTHGVLYENVPCVCSKYKISIDEVGGYDVKTLLPKKINIILTLHESRIGNFSKFTPGVSSEFENRDAITGWESVIGSPFKLDPGKLNGQ